MKISLLLLVALAGFALAADAPYDWNRAKQIYARAERGETLTPDEQKILDEAKRRHDAGEPIPADAAPSSSPSSASSTPSAASATPSTSFDWNRAKEIFQRAQRGESI